MSASVSLLGESGWLSHIQSILAGVAWIAARVAMESASVLVHCRLAILRPHHHLTVLLGDTNVCVKTEQLSWFKKTNQFFFF